MHRLMLIFDGLRQHDSQEDHLGKKNLFWIEQECKDSYPSGHPSWSDLVSR
jgi:hypothetical protein